MPGVTAALATPDRALARRALAALARWNVTVNDSGGVPYRTRPPGFSRGLPPTPRSVALLR